MKSLEELNGYSDQEVEYTDERPVGVLFDRATPTNQTLLINENQTHTLPRGIEITDIIDYAAAEVYLTLDFTDIESDDSTTIDTISIDDTDFPEHMFVELDSYSAFRIGPLHSVADWITAVSATIQLPFRYSGTFVYTATIEYFDQFEDEQSVAWSVNTTVNAIEYLSAPAPFVYTPRSTQTISTVAIDADTSTFNPVWTLTITPSSTAPITTATSTGIGGSFAFNATTKVITITGNKTQVNSHLSNISVTFSEFNPDFTFVFNLSNSLNDTVDIQVQQIVNNQLIAFVASTATVSANGMKLKLAAAAISANATMTTINSRIRNQSAAPGVVASVVITDAVLDAVLLSAPGADDEFYVNKEFFVSAPSLTVNNSIDGNFTVVIYDPDQAIQTITTQGSGGTVTVSSPTSGNGYRIMEIVGSVAQINSHLDTLAVKSKTTRSSDFTIQYIATFGVNGYYYNVSHSINYVPDFLYVESWPEDSAPPIPTWLGRIYLSNTTNSIFGDSKASNTRQFAFTPNDPDYTNLSITLTASQGKFYNKNTSEYDNPLTFSGTYSTLEDLMTDIDYYPPYNHTGNITVSFTSTKDGVAGQSGSFAITRTGAGTYSGSTVSLQSPGAFSWTPTPSDLEYGKLNYAIVGGGGGGSYRRGSYITNPITFTLNGGVGLSTTEKKFGNASIYFDGTNDQLSSQTPDLNLGLVNDKSFDFWIRPDDVVGNKTLVEFKSTSNSSSIKIFQDGALIKVTATGNTGGTYNLASSAITAGTWTHIAYQHQEDNTISNRRAILFINGTRVDEIISATDINVSITSIAASLSIGANVNGTNFYKGYMDEFRISIDPYLNSSGFTAPTSEYTFADPVDVNTIFIHANIIAGEPSWTPVDTFLGETQSGNGGGGGEVEHLADQTLINKTYTGTVGAAGVNGYNIYANRNGTAGGSTTFDGITVAGGGGATAPVQDVGYGVGGTSGSGNLGDDYGSVNPNNNVGGGGGGDSGTGGEPYLLSGTWRGGDGGAATFTVAGGNLGRGGAGGGPEGSSISSNAGRGGKGFSAAGPNYEPQPGGIFITVTPK